jgi:hypothetical protein
MPRRLALVAMLVLALALAVSATASAARHMEIAVQDDPVLFAGFYANPETGLRYAEQFHTSQVRVNVVWSYVVGKSAKKKKAPKRIHYNWSGYDALLRNLKRHGMKLQMVLTGNAPAWATGHHKVGHDDVKATAFKAFASAAAKHFKGRVDRYTIWNEPNFVGWLSPMKRSPKIYRALYSAGYSAIKRADRKAKVLIGETSPYEIARGRNAMAPLKFLRAVACAKNNYKRARKCSALKTDGYAHHPYDFRHKPTYKYPGKDNVTMATLGRLTSALAKLRKAHLLSTPSGGVPYLYLTEYGYFSSGKYKLSERKQASYLIQGFKMAQRNPRVKQVLQFLLFQTSGNFNFDTSIIRRNGKPRLAYTRLVAWARGAAKKGAIRVVHGPATTNVIPPPAPPTPPPGGGGGSGGGGSGGGGSGGGSGGGGSGGGGAGNSCIPGIPASLCP